VYPAEDQSMTESDWITDPGGPGPVLLDCLRAAAAAPSIHNSQPWLFRIRDGAAEVRTDRRRRLRILDTEGREQFISIGAAVFNLRVAIHSAGRSTSVHLMPDAADPGLAARVAIGPAVEASPAVRALADAIPRRRTNRRPFADKPLPYGTMEELSGAAAAEGATLLVVEPGLRSGVLALTRTADNRMRQDPAYRAELAAWTAQAGSNRRDGIPRHAIGPRDRDSALPLRDLGIGHGFPAATVEFEPEPTLVVLYSPDDTATGWLRAGQALQRLWLTATVRGLAVTPMSQLTEISALRTLLADSFTGSVAQIVLRIGYPLWPALPTPRRPLADMLLSTDGTEPARG
jgi:nitroreductase